MTSLTHTAPTLTFMIPDTHSSIAGHFPHNPLVAGAILLGQARQHLQGHIQTNIDSQTNINSVSRLRFNQPVLPNQPIYVEYLQKNDHQWRFSGLVEGKPAFKGVFSCEEAIDTYTDQAAIEPAPNCPIAAPSLYQHLPHDGLMQLIDTVDAWDERSIHCVTRSHLSSVNPLLNEGELASTSAIEYAAQALALHAVTMMQAGGVPDQANKAFVVSAKGLKFDDVDISKLDQALNIYATVLIGNAQSAVYSVQVSAGQQCLLRGDLGVMSQRD